METEADGHSSSHRRQQQLSATDSAGPKACATCRLAHASCDRNQPCARCVRLGKADSCQPSPTRKRGRPPRKAPPDEPPQQPARHHQPPQGKRARVRPTTTNAAVMPDDTTTTSTACHHPQLCPTTTASSPSPSTTTTATHAASSSPPPRLSPADSDECASSWSSPSSSLAQREARSRPGHRGFAPAAGQEHEQDSQGLWSLLMDQMREMLRENERLRDTVAQLCATQKETERRLARVEHDYRTIKLTQTRTELELNRKSDHYAATHRLDHVHVNTSPAWPPSLSSGQAAAARPAIPPQTDSRSTVPPAQSLWCVGVPHGAAAAPTTSPGAEVERFIAQTLPFLRQFDQSSLIIRDLQLPFVVVHMQEAERLQDLMPTIVYASPSLCSLLGYKSFELLGAPISSFGLADQEFLPMLAEIALMPSPTPVGQPLGVTGIFDTKDGRVVRVSTTHQFLYSQRRTAQWLIMQVDNILESFPAPRLRFVNDPTARAIAREHLMAQLHSLLSERRGRALTTTTQLPDAAHHQRLRHQTPVEPLTGQQRDDAVETQHELRADAELEELIRALAAPIQSSGVSSGSRVRSPQMTVGFTSLPPPTPSSLAERWMR